MNDRLRLSEAYISKQWKQVYETSDMQGLGRINPLQHNSFTSENHKHEQLDHSWPIPSSSHLVKMLVNLKKKRD